MYENLDRDFLIKKADEVWFRGYSKDDFIHNACGATRYCVIFEELGVVLKREDSNYEGGFCDREAFLYQKAKEYHIERAFLPIEYFGCGWFIQPYANLAVWPALKSNSISSKHKVKFNTFRSRMRDVDIDSAWLLHLYEYYGWDFFKSFFYFCKRYKVNDLHCGNVGFINKKPVVFDYSGVPWKGRC